MSDEEREEEEAPPPPPEPIVRVLERSTIEDGLSQLCKSVAGDAFVFTKLDLSLAIPVDEEAEEEENPGPPPRLPEGFTDISLISEFKQLRYINFANSNLAGLAPLDGLELLLAINFENNLITSLEVFERAGRFPYLQDVNLSKNKITSVSSLELPMLVDLNLSNNQITSMPNLTSLPLRRLDLRNNKLTSTAGLCVSTLEQLLLGANEISTLEGVNALVAVQTLDLGFNKIESLEGLNCPDVKTLSTLDLRKNLFKKTKEMDNLRCFAKTLKTLQLADTTFATEAENYRIRTLRRLPKLKMLDEEEITEDDLEAIKEDEEPDPEDVVEEPTEEEG